MPNEASIDCAIYEAAQEILGDPSNPRFITVNSTEILVDLQTLASWGSKYYTLVQQSMLLMLPAKEESKPSNNNT